MNGQVPSILFQNMAIISDAKGIIVLRIVLEQKKNDCYPIPNINSLLH